MPDRYVKLEEDVSPADFGPELAFDDPEKDEPLLSGEYAIGDIVSRMPTYWHQALKQPANNHEDNVRLWQELQSARIELTATPESSSDWQSADAKAKAAYSQLVSGNIRFVELLLHRSKAYRFVQHLSADDLRLEGVFGLMSAIEDWDPEQASILRLASGRIIQKFWQARQNQEQVIKLPVKLDRMARRVAEVADKSGSRTAEEIAELSFVEEPVLMYGSAPSRRYYGPVEFVCAALHRRENFGWQQYDEADEHQQHNYHDITPTGEVAIEAAEAKVTLETILAQLDSLDDKRLGQIIRWRYGLIDGKELKLEQIRHLLGGISRERVSQLEQRAMSAMRVLATGGKLEQTEAYLGQKHYRKIKSTSNKKKTANTPLSDEEKKNRRLEKNRQNFNALKLQPYSAEIDFSQPDSIIYGLTIEDLPGVCSQIETALAEFCGLGHNQLAALYDLTYGFSGSLPASRKVIDAAETIFPSGSRCLVKFLSMDAIRLDNKPPLSYQIRYQIAGRDRSGNLQVLCANSLIFSSSRGWGRVTDAHWADRNKAFEINLRSRQRKLEKLAKQSDGVIDVKPDILDL